MVALEQAVAGPMCTVRLADAGARVIKVERAGGETARHYDHAVQGTSAYFAWLNRGKESAVLDLKAPDDLALFHRMLEKADVLVQNMVPGAMDRMGLSAEDIARRYPRLIAVGIVGYGQDTDYAPMRAYDMLIQAESGVCSVTGTPEVPCKIGVSAADIATGAAAHAAVLEALVERSITGRGKVIEIAMFDVMADWMAVPLLHYEQEGRHTARHGLSHAAIYPYRPFVCADGMVIVAARTMPSGKSSANRSCCGPIWSTIRCSPRTRCGSRTARRWMPSWSRCSRPCRWARPWPGSRRRPWPGAALYRGRKPGRPPCPAPHHGHRAGRPRRDHAAPAGAGPTLRARPGPRHGPAQHRDPGRICLIRG